MKSNQEWQAWGKEDPLYAVASWDGRQKGGANPWTDDEFYRLGSQDWSDYRSQWKAYGLRPGHLLEIGCGAGRMTNPMAEDFAHVTAVDVSADQIAYARQRVKRPNIEFFVTEGVALPLQDNSIDAVFSCHVFQHFDSLDDAAAVFAELQRVLAPDGSLCIHLPLFHLPNHPVSPLVRRLLDAWKALGNWKADRDRRRGKLIMRGLWYEQPWLLETLARLGFVQLQIRGFATASNGHWHDIVLARKSAPSPVSPPPATG